MHTPQQALGALSTPQWVPCARAQRWTAVHVKKINLISRDPIGWQKLIADLAPDQAESAYELLAQLAAKENPLSIARMLNKGQWVHVFPGRWDAAELFRVRADVKGLSKAMTEAKELRARLEAFTVEATEGNLTPQRLAKIEARLLPKIEATEARVSKAALVAEVAEVMGPQAREVWARWSTAQRRDLLRAIVRPGCCPPSAGGPCSIRPQSS